MAASVYVESSVISYLAARPSQDVIIAGRQAITLDWWQNRRREFEVYISTLVEEEISSGNPREAGLRMQAVADLPSLVITDQAEQLAESLIRAGAVPASDAEDALHIGIAAAQGMEYLLTWNFKHINNARTKSAIIRTVERLGLICPVLCSPEELGG